MRAATGILGGSFDPVHKGHIRIAVYCRRRFGLRQVRLIPLNLPAHRPPPAASAAHRLRMLRLAAASRPGLFVDDLELRRGGPSYTVETLRELRRQGRNGVLCLIMGEDVFATLPTWRQWRRLFDDAHLVVLRREAEHDCRPAARRFPPALAEQWARRGSADTRLLHRCAAGRIFRLPLPPLPYSSTQARRDLRERPHDRAANPALPAAVFDYIRAHRLYA